MLAQNNLAFANDIRISLPVLAATAWLALAAGVVMGAYPALQGSRTDIVSVLRDGGRTMAGALGSHRARARSSTAQVAVSLVLLIGAGLLVTSFAKLRSQPTGFDSTHDLRRRRQSAAGALSRSRRAGPLLAAARRRTANAPGVERAALAQTPPLSGGFTRAPYALAEGAMPPLNERPLGLTVSVTPGYFATMQHSAAGRPRFHRTRHRRRAARRDRVAGDRAKARRRTADCSAAASSWARRAAAR